MMKNISWFTAAVAVLFLLFPLPPGCRSACIAWKNGLLYDPDMEDDR